MKMTLSFEIIVYVITQITGLVTLYIAMNNRILTLESEMKSLKEKQAEGVADRNEIWKAIEKVSDEFARVSQQLSVAVAEIKGAINQIPNKLGK